jgi:hypothetical protein
MPSLFEARGLDPDFSKEGEAIEVWKADRAHLDAETILEPLRDYVAIAPFADGEIAEAKQAVTNCVRI